jgi:hypothetical protein
MKSKVQLHGDVIEELAYRAPVEQRGKDAWPGRHCALGKSRVAG